MNLERKQLQGSQRRVPAQQDRIANNKRAQCADTRCRDALRKQPCSQRPGEQLDSVPLHARLRHAPPQSLSSRARLRWGDYAVVTRAGHAGWPRGQPLDAAMQALRGVRCAALLLALLLTAGGGLAAAAGSPGARVRLHEGGGGAAPVGSEAAPGATAAGGQGTGSIRRRAQGADEGVLGAQAAAPPSGSAAPVGQRAQQAARAQIARAGPQQAPCRAGAAPEVAGRVCSGARAAAAGGHAGGRSLQAVNIPHIIHQVCMAPCTRGPC